jgi:hypothetical protein
MKVPLPPGLVVAISVWLFHVRLVTAQAPSVSPSLAPVPPPPPNFLISPASSRPQSGPPVPGHPPPNPLPIPPAPPPPTIVRPSPRLDVAEIQRLTPRVEIWRPNGQRPQVPSRRGRVMETGFVTGTEPVTLRLQFDPRAAGERVRVFGGNSLSLTPPEQVLTVSSRGECIVTGQLNADLARGHVIFYCGMLKTVVPLTRAPIARIAAEETRTGGRP